MLREAATTRGEIVLLKGGNFTQRDVAILYSQGLN